MKKDLQQTDKELGMHRKISRRDMLHGLGALSLGALSVGSLSSCSTSLLSGHAANNNKPITGKIKSLEPVYPPASTGLRGNHQGSFEVAHKLGRENIHDWGTVIAPDDIIYDVVIVGAGISGLSAAHFHQKKHPDAKILLIDNHDDFGGHAKRNEFSVGNETLIGYGGAQTLQEPTSYSKVVKGLLDDLGIEKKRFDKAYDQQFFKRNKLSCGIHFNKEKWGVDKIVPMNIGAYSYYLPVAKPSLTISEAVKQMPISDGAKIEFEKLLTLEEDQLTIKSQKDKIKYLKTISYRKFLEKDLNITEDDIFKILQDLASDFGVGIDAASAWDALSYAGLPGWEAAGLSNDESEEEAYIHHFPDGNASIARLIVRRLIPEVASGNTMSDIVTTKFDYSKLDQEKASLRLRLNSTAVNVKQVQTTNIDEVHVTYIQNDQAYRVKAKGCVLACNNTIIPHLCPDMPKVQRDALDSQEKMPILYTNVVLRNWQAWKNLNIGTVVSPGSYHIVSMLDFPVSLGNYKFSQDSDKPIIVHMERFPHINNAGKTPKEQHRLGRHELITTPFETIERNVRKQLASMLGQHGFDAERDIIGITVNRWAHGYAYWYKPMFETVYEDRDDERYPHMIARKPFGKITIANADSGAKAMFESAVEQGYRAINELN